jgi:hypothetical protein
MLIFLLNILLFNNLYVKLFQMFDFIVVVNLDFFIYLYYYYYYYIMICLKVL